MTRRALLRRGALIPLASLPVLSGCGGAISQCAAPNTLSRGEEQMRKARQYEEISPREYESCGNCQFFQGHTGEACGMCDILNGPVNQGGHCTSWAELG